MNRKLLAAALLMPVAMWSSGAWAADAGIGFTPGSGGNLAAVTGPSNSYNYPVHTIGDATNPDTKKQCVTAGGGACTDLIQVNGVTLSVGAGTQGNGSLRTTQSQDPTTIAGAAPGTQSAPSTAVITVVPIPSSSASIGIVPFVAGSSAQSIVAKAGPGNLYNAYAYCTLACWLMTFNSTTVPANGATTAGVASGNLQNCIPILAGGAGGTNLGAIGPPEQFTVGISVAISSTACGTLTLSSTAFIHGMVE